MLYATLEELEGLPRDDKIGVLLHQGHWHLHSSIQAMAQTFQEELEELGYVIVLKERLDD